MTDPVQWTGNRSDPVLKALLPDPASLGHRTKGKNKDWAVFTGVRTEKKNITISTMYVIIRMLSRSRFQAISYTTGVPAMCGALMMLTGKWIRPGGIYCRRI